MVGLNKAKTTFIIEQHEGATVEEEPLPRNLSTCIMTPGRVKFYSTIASSGEISRVMLAVKSSLATQDPVSLLVFDEIDANVGGEIAHQVGAKMRSLGQAHQVLCITHLPQVAALGDAQFVVTKEFAHSRTESNLREVRGDSRVEEIARMLGGKTDSALAHARELLGAPKPPTKSKRAAAAS